MSKRRLLPFFLALISFAAAYPEYPAKSAREYPAAVEKAGLVIAAVPVEDQKDQNTYFGMNLRSKGFIPVLLIIENSTSKESFLLDKKNIAFSPSARSTTMLANPANPSHAEKTVAVIGSVPTIYTFLATIATSRSKELRQHLLKTELQSATLSPGASVHGFVFIPERTGYSSRQKIQLTIPFRRPGSDEVVSIETTL